MSTVADTTTSPHQRPAPPKTRKTRRPRGDGQGRAAVLLVGPTMLLLGVVLLYPLVKAVVMSFQKDSGLDPATGMFAASGNAGLSNYQHWLLQQCATAAGGTVDCPPGSLGSQFYDALWVT